MPDLFPTEEPKKTGWHDWACRILMTLDVLVIISGYLSYYQAKRQLVSPLIPKDTAVHIWQDGLEYTLKSSIIAAMLFVAGLWLYSFNKKLPAIVLFAAAPVYFYLLSGF